MIHLEEKGANSGVCVQSTATGEPAAGLHAPIQLPGDNYSLHAHPAIHETRVKKVQTKSRENGNIGARKITQEGHITDHADGGYLRRAEARVTCTDHVTERKMKRNNKSLWSSGQEKIMGNTEQKDAASPTVFT